MIRFRAWGHPNVKATHKTTIEFTKDEHLTPNGDCIVGVRADFDVQKVARFAKEHDEILVTIQVGGVKETLTAKANKQFHDENEIVIRMGQHISPRTFATNASKSAKFLNRELVNALQMGSPMEVTIEKAAK